MEAIYAGITNEDVVNTFVADEDFLDIVANDYELIINVTDISPRPSCGWKYVNGEFKDASPYPSWMWNGEDWESPIGPAPSAEYLWNEDSRNWILPEE